MCDLKQPKPTSGPALCMAGQELVVRRVMEGDRNEQIRAALRKEKHYHDLSDNAFTPYRKMPVVKEARIAALANMRDVGVASLSRRIDVLEAGLAQVFKEAYSTKDNTEKATLFRAAVAGCKELSRLVDVIDPEGLDGIPNAGESVPAPVSIEQILAGFEALTIRKRKGEFVPGQTGQVASAEASS